MADEGERVVARVRPFAGSSRPARYAGRRRGGYTSYHRRMVVDVPIDSRQMVVHVRVRMRVWVWRLVCSTRAAACTASASRCPGYLERYPPSHCLIGQVKAVVKKVRGGAGARVLAILAVSLSPHGPAAAFSSSRYPPGEAVV